MKKEKDILTIKDMKRVIRILKKKKIRCYLCGKWLEKKYISSYISSLMVIYGGILGQVCIRCEKKLSELK